MKKTAIIAALLYLSSSAGLFADEGHTGAVNGIAVHPEGRRAASCSDDGTIIIWDLEKGSVLSRIEAHDDYVLGVD